MLCAAYFHGIFINKMGKLILQKKQLWFFIIMFGVAILSQARDHLGHSHFTTGDTIYLDPVNAPGNKIRHEGAAPDMGAFEFDVSSFNHP